MSKSNLFFFAVFLFFSFKVFSQGYRIETQITPLSDVNIYLGYHYGNEQFVIDTVHLDKSGKGVFSGKKTLPEGVYMIVLPNMIYFDFLIADESKLSITNDTTDLNKNLVIKGSPQNEIFVKYQSYTSEVRAVISGYLARTEQKKDSAAFYRNEIDKLQKEMFRERDRIILMYPKTFFGALLKSMSDVEVPKELNQDNDPETISKRIDYLSHHYFDNYDFSDERLLFSPVLYNKLNKYFGELVMADPDSVNTAIDFILVKSMQTPDVYRYILNQMMILFDVSGELAFDEAFVYLAQNYYYNGLASWVDDQFLEKLKKHVEDLKPTLIGSLTPTLVLSDINGKNISVDEIRSCYTAVYFWNPECEHCINYILELKKLKDKFPDDFFQVYAVLGEKNVDKWKTFINDNKLTWINVYDPKHKNEFVDSYKLYMIPRIFILDKTKHIVLKDIAINQLEEFLIKQQQKGCN